MWVLVTGAGGFVGSHIVRSFVANGVPVIALQRKWGKIEGVPDQDTCNFSRVIGDLNADIEISVNVSTIVHCAAAVVLPGKTANDFAVGNINPASGAINLVHRLNIKKIILMSSISIFGSGERDIITETSDVISPASYGASKYLVELMFKEFADKCPVVVVRTPGIVGRGANPTLLTSIIDKLKNGKTVTLSNPEKLFNHFVHVSDVGNFIISASAQKLPNGFFPVNLAPTATLTLLEIVESIHRFLCSNSKIQLDDHVGRSTRIGSNRNVAPLFVEQFSTQDTIKKLLED